MRLPCRTVLTPDTPNRHAQGKPPADSLPLSLLLVALREVFEDLAQFVKLRRSVS